MEAEFDRGQFETVSEREAGERELWEPIASSPFFTDTQNPGGAPFFPSARGEAEADELDISEAQFIQSFSKTATLLKMFFSW